MLIIIINNNNWNNCVIKLTIIKLIIKTNKWQLWQLNGKIKNKNSSDMNTEKNMNVKIIILWMKFN